MTSADKERLEAFLTAEARQRKRVLVLLWLVGVFGVLAFVLAACAPVKPFASDAPAASLPTTWQTRPITCPVCGLPPVLACTTYRCEKGHRFEFTPDEP